MFFKEKKTCKQGRFQHTSLSRGKPVLFAGMVDFDATGKIQKISNSSGHYQTTIEQLQQFIDYLSSQGADLSGTVIKKYKFDEKTQTWESTEEVFVDKMVEAA